MGRVKSATNQSLETFGRKRRRNADDGISSPWPNLPHDVLFLILMNLGVLDFVAFSGVCRLWRLFAHANRQTFVSSQGPLLVSIPPYAKKTCHLHDLSGRTFKTRLPDFARRSCVGVSCGHLIMFAKKARDFRLVNPVTKNELSFPALPPDFTPRAFTLRPVLVFYPSLSSLVLVVLSRYSQTILFALPGHAHWERLVTGDDLRDLHVFKGRLYVLHRQGHLSELRLRPEPTLTPRIPGKGPELGIFDAELVSSTEKLFMLLDTTHIAAPRVHEIDFEKAEQVPIRHEYTEQYAFFRSELKCCAMVERGNGASETLDTAAFHPWVVNGTIVWQRMFTMAWYFPWDCFCLNLLRE